MGHRKSSRNSLLRVIHTPILLTLMYTMIRNFAIKLLIWYAERDLYNTPVRKVLDEKQMKVFYAALFDLPGAKQYFIERETRFLHAQANTWQPTVQGQRTENSILFYRARLASEEFSKDPNARGLPRAQRSTGARP